MQCACNQHIIMSNQHSRRHHRCCICSLLFHIASGDLFRPNSPPPHRSGHPWLEEPVESRLRVAQGHRRTGFKDVNLGVVRRRTQNHDGTQGSLARKRKIFVGQGKTLRMFTHDKWKHPCLWAAVSYGLTLTNIPRGPWPPRPKQAHAEKQH